MNFDVAAAKCESSGPAYEEWRKRCELFEVPLVTITMRRRFGSIHWSVETLPESQRVIVQQQIEQILGDILNLHRQYQNDRSSCTVSANGGDIYDVEVAKCSELAESLFKYLLTITGKDSRYIH